MMYIPHMMQLDEGHWNCTSTIMIFQQLVCDYAAWQCLHSFLLCICNGALVVSVTGFPLGRIGGSKPVMCSDYRAFLM